MTDRPRRLRTKGEQQLDAHEELMRRRRVTSSADLQRLRGSLETHLDLVDENSFDYDQIDVDLARRVTKVLIALVDAAADFDVDQRAVLRGAIDYFIDTDDAQNDLTSPVGLQDDAAVVNEACVTLGRSDLCIDLA